ncbi:uncharacterized protein DUF742 [Prauserella shujinwangii]|uniref:Uncharacterized protein DUF742 n=1 Tax=Prauserella shujinwangii TaxID=1453103 RepID=A0A2T0M359_9PSEU|nr:DUF742 domain-containing protein [Prauserella shujinwangii]PRX51183.1 uncharacterized protein DUF742 [Prauserella shujinwangii]
MSTGPGHSGEEDGSTVADVLDGFTLDSGRGRRTRSKDIAEPGEDGGRGAPEQHTAASPVWPGYPPPAAAPSGAGNPAGSRYTTREEQPVSAEAVPLPPAEETGFVRPYAITGGRTKANHPLELETLISTREGALMAVPDQVEHQMIMEECRTPRSVAEIAAALRVPFGVARVLISDVADAGLVTVHKTISGDEGAEAHLMLMERVLSGLRRL